MNPPLTQQRIDEAQSLNKAIGTGLNVYALSEHKYTVGDLTDLITISEQVTKTLQMAKVALLNGK